MPTTVVLDASGRIEAEDIASVLAEAGATGVAIDKRTGDGMASDYFYISFFDPTAPNPEARYRTGEGRHAVPSEDSPIGWTRFGLGSDNDGRGAHFIDAAGLRFGGQVNDYRTGSRQHYDYPLEVAEQLEASTFYSM